jgi:hypothetical protein
MGSFSTRRAQRDRVLLGFTSKTFGNYAGEHVDYKRAKGKRTVDEDRVLLERGLIPFFGPGTVLL